MSNNHSTYCISLVPIFNHLDLESQAIIATKLRSKNLKRNEFLYNAGDHDDTLYIVRKGQIRITHISESGKEQLIRLLNPGDFTGEWTIFTDSSKHTNYAQATQDTEICSINRIDLEELLNKYPRISSEILKTMAVRLQESQNQTTSITTQDVTTRVIYYIKGLIDSDSKDETTVTLPMSKKDLASYLGTTPETLSRRFTQLEEKGLIKQLPKNKVYIQSVEELSFAAL